MRSSNAPAANPTPRSMVSGSGYFSSIIKNRTRPKPPGSAPPPPLGMILLMWIAYRHFGFTLLGALPLVSGALAGLAAVSALFASVHGITLAFGFTLIGVAQDYPMHLFSHLEPRNLPLETARAGVAAAGHRRGQHLHRLPGLLHVGRHRAGATRLPDGDRTAGGRPDYPLPAAAHRAGTTARDPAASALLARLNARISGCPGPSTAGRDSAVALAVFLLRPEGFWQNDLSKLTPVPPELLRADSELRREMATPDLRYLLVASGASEDAVLGELEALEPAA